MNSAGSIRRRKTAALGALALAATAAFVVTGGTDVLGGEKESGEPAQAAGSERSASRGQSDAGPRRMSPGTGDGRSKRRRQQAERIEWRDSVAVGSHAAGSLKRGVLLPAEGLRWVSWDPIFERRPNREWRRWGADRLVRKTLRVLGEFGAAHPNAPRVAVGDLSRPEGGDFGPQFGSIGHASHQNGLDVDVYYPRKDGRVRPPDRPDQVQLDWSQELVDRFVAVGAEKVFVGPSLGLEGPPDVVVPLVNHDNHLHFRLPLP